MKPTLLRILRLPVLALALSAIATPAISYAQNAAQPPGAQRNRANARPQAGGRLQQIIEKLDLSDEQKAKLKPIMDELRTQTRAAMQNSADQSDRRKQIREATATAQKQIGEILTPEQRTKLAELMREQRAGTTQPTTQAAGRGDMIGQIEAVALGLDLTPEQQTKVKELSKEYSDEVAAMDRDNAGNKGRNPQMRTAVMEYRSRITQLLTPEQTEQFNKKLEEMRPARAADGAGARQGNRQGKRAQRPGKTV